MNFLRHFLSFLVIYIFLKKGSSESVFSMENPMQWLSISILKSFDDVFMKPFLLLWFCELKNQPRITSGG